MAEARDVEKALVLVKVAPIDRIAASKRIMVSGGFDGLMGS